MGDIHGTIQKRRKNVGKPNEQGEIRISEPHKQHNNYLYRKIVQKVHIKD